MYRRAPDAELRTTPRINPGAVHNRPHTLRRQARTDDAFLLAVRGANAMAGARPHRAEPGAPGAPDEGRCRADPHCTSDGDGRHSSTRDLFRVFQQYVRGVDAGIPPRGEQPTPDCEDRRHADVVFPSPIRREDGGLFQRRRIGERGDLPHRVRLSEVTCGRTAVSEGTRGTTAGRRASSIRGQRHAAAAATGTGSCTCTAPAPAPTPAPRRRRPAQRPTPPVPTRLIGPVSVNTSPMTTTARAMAARTSSNSLRGARSRGCPRRRRTTRRRCRMPPPSSSIHSAAGSRGAPATSAGCEYPALKTPRITGARTKDNTEQEPQRATHNRPHTLRRSSARTDDAFPLAVRGVNAMAGARPHRAEPGARRARARRREVPCGFALH